MRGKMVQCPQCGRQFKNTQGLTGHQRWVHQGRRPLGGAGRPGLRQLKAQAKTAFDLRVAELEKAGLNVLLMDCLADCGKLGTVTDSARNRSILRPVRGTPRADLVDSQGQVVGSAEFVISPETNRKFFRTLKARLAGKRGRKAGVASRGVNR